MGVELEALLSVVMVVPSFLRVTKLYHEPHESCNRGKRTKLAAYDNPVGTGTGGGGWKERRLRYSICGGTGRGGA